MSGRVDESDEGMLERLQAVSDAAWDEIRRLLDVARRKGNVAGVWRGVSLQDDGVMVMPWMDYDEDAWSLIEMLYEVGLVVEFDWSELLQRSGYADRLDISAIPIADVVRVTTALVRADKYNEGAIYEYFQDGKIPAVINRLLDWHDAQSATVASVDSGQRFGSAIERVEAGWDEYVERFLSGGGAVPPDLERWAESYQGTGTGAVEWNALPEPYLGDLRGDVRGVFLALNPGEAVLEFQGRTGVFADEIRAFGSYRDWASSWAYLRDPWIEEVGPNRHHRSRLKFLRRWVGEPNLPASAMVGFELYPWHSKSVKGKMQPPVDYVREWVWEPIAELDAPVFAFGAAWFDVLEHGLGLRVLSRLGPGGEDYGSTVESRTVLVLSDDQTGVTVIAEKHMGSAGPPSADETDLLRSAVARYTAT